MSALVPVIATEPDEYVSQPSFSVVMRGYDRHQVAFFVEDMAQRLADQRRRADETAGAMAEMRLEIAALKNQPPPSFEHLGAEAARVLEQAGGSARLLVEEAESRAGTIIEKAEAEAEGMRQKVLQDHAAILAETKQLYESRDWVLEYLAGIHSYLDALLGQRVAQQQVASDGDDDASGFTGSAPAEHPAS
ncbi:MAG TPA: DivIVA domain-containing protein [Candidatus Dormibacteraeota bacterium]|nr:DivIVA domain-containing protein [Candidatus Dormibacteraeota bacterium]